MILHTLLRGYRAWKRRVAERRELMQLTDRELADIGISRSEIDPEHAPGRTCTTQPT